MVNHRETGDRFELFVEELFRDLGYRDVRRNVVYTRFSRLKGYQGRRQVDVEARISLFTGKTIFELKYLSTGERGRLPLHYRNDNLVVTVNDRRKFCKAPHTSIVTNVYFGDDLILEANEYGIGLLDREDLIGMDIQRGGDGDIERAVAHIDLRRRGASIPQRVYCLI